MSHQEWVSLQEWMRLDAIKTLIQLGVLVVIVLGVIGKVIFAIYDKGARDICRCQFTKDEWDSLKPYEQRMIVEGSWSVKAAHAKLLRDAKYHQDSQNEDKTKSWTSTKDECGNGKRYEVPF